MGKFIDLTGQSFGRWTVLCMAPNRIGGRESWLCQCDCGTVRIVLGKSLKSGRSKSCGCIAREKTSLRMIEKHRKDGCDGRARTRLYSIWVDMKRRCEDSRHSTYANYGARGIKVCSDWTKSFDSFRQWALENGYSQQLSIDRINNDGDYTPDNCRWATAVIQGNNKRNNHLVTAFGETHTLTEWEHISGIGRSTILSRINKHGWPVERALTEPVKHTKRK